MEQISQHQQTIHDYPHRKEEVRTCSQNPVGVSVWKLIYCVTTIATKLKKDLSKTESEVLESK